MIYVPSMDFALNPGHERARSPASGFKTMAQDKDRAPRATPCNPKGSAKARCPWALGSAAEPTVKKLVISGAVPGSGMGLKATG